VGGHDRPDRGAVRDRPVRLARRGHAHAVGLREATFIVFAANAFALLGLRALYFLVTGLLDRLVYLSTGLSLILLHRRQAAAALGSPAERQRPRGRHLDVAGGDHGRRLAAQVAPHLRGPRARGDAARAARGTASSGDLSAAGELGDEPPERLLGQPVLACTFGGPRLDQLYITTSRENLPAGEDPQAGALFQAQLSIAGRPVHELAG
jgi:hypothetical protein